jgi:CobQ-like glutamine amidotransferase family enzyme
MKRLRILHLYSKDMNIYGDTGNILVLQKRAKWLGVLTEVVNYNPRDRFPTDFDILVGGGGQDSGQSTVCFDLKKVGPEIIRHAEDGVPMLLVCGLYQLFGEYFKPYRGQQLPGIGLFPIATQAQKVRMIGNVAAESREFGTLVGFENHSGNTELEPDAVPLAYRVRQGFGNNVSKLNEGCRIYNCIGTYLHGSFLPKNPRVADWLLERACSNKGWTLDLSSAEIPQAVNKFEEPARQQAELRPY